MATRGSKCAQEIAPQQCRRRSLPHDEKTAEDYLGEEVTEAVITVPAYFTTRSARPPRTRAASRARRQAHHHEPTAAALAFGSTRPAGRTKMPVYAWAAATVRHLDHRDADVEGRDAFEGALHKRRHLPRRRGLRPALIDYVVTEFKKDQA